MRPEELGEEITIELELMDATVQELLALQRDAAERELTTWSKKPKKPGFSEKPRFLVRLTLPSACIILPSVSIQRASV